MSNVKNSIGDIPANLTQIGGSHYTSLSIQPWAAMESWMTPTEFSGYLRGNVIKYLARSGHKPGQGMQDLEKAQHYMQKLIEHESSNR